MTNKTYKSKFLAIALCFAMCLALMLGVVFASGANVAYAEESAYQTIGGTVDGSGTGWSFDSTSGTLTLTNYNGKAISLTGAVKKVVLKGTNTITLNALTDTNKANALFGYDFTISSDGDASLTINADLSAVAAGTTAYTVYGINVKNGLTIAGDAAVKVNVKGQGNLYGICYEYSSSACTGIAVQDKATLDVSIEVVGETKYAGYGVYCEFNQYDDTEKGVSFSGSGAKTVTVKGNDYALGISGQHVDISGEGKVTVDLQSAPSGTGIYALHCANMDNADVEVKNALEGIAGYGKYRSASNCSQSKYKILVKNSTVKITSVVAASKGLYCSRYAGAGIYYIENSTVTIDTKEECVYGSGTAWEVYGKSVVDLTSANASVIYTPDYSLSKFALSDGGSVTIKSTQSTRAVWTNSVVTLEENTRLVEGTPYKSDGETKYYSIEGNPSVLKFAYSTTKTTATIAGSDGTAVYIRGAKGQPIAEKDVVVTIADDTFTGVSTNDVVTGWFENMPTGLVAKVKSVSTDGKVVTITASGTPTATSNEEIKVKIPADKMTSATEDVVASRTLVPGEYSTAFWDAKFEIGESVAVPSPSTTSFEYDGSEKICVEEGTGYTVKNGKATNAGSYKAELTLKGGYTWADGTTTKKEIAWTITRKPVSGVTATLEGVTDGKMDYKGWALEPNVIVKYADGTNVNTSDYTVEYKNNVNIGTATVTVKANGNYAFEDITLNFEIVLASTPAPTGLKGIAPTAQDGTDGKITGTTSKMEYSTDKEFTSPVDCADSETTGLSQGVYYVRFKATATTAASDYATVNVKFFSVTVTGGSGTGKYREGETVTVTLGEIPAGKTFKQWDFAGVSISAEDMVKDSFTFTMPDKDVKITALYNDIEYSVNIVSGSADKTTVKYGDTITLTANDAPEGKEFKGWQDASGNIVSTDVEYKFTVSGEVNLTAVYADKAVDPVDPVEPTDPTDPTEPTEPTEPTIDKEEPKGLSGGAIAGIVVGSVAVAGIGGFAIFWFAVKKKSFADLGVAIKNGCRKAGNFFKKLGEKIKSLFKKK